MLPRVKINCHLLSSSHHFIYVDNDLGSSIMPRGYSSSIGSASTYSPLLINPSSQPESSFVPPPTNGHRLSLRYAYPLVPLASLDALYTLHHHISASQGLPGDVLTTGIARALVLFAVGCTQRWRARGGWVGVVKAVSIFMAIWEACRRVLSRNLENDGNEGLETNLIWFLMAVSLPLYTKYTMRRWS